MCSHLWYHPEERPWFTDIGTIVECQYNRCCPAHSSSACTNSGCGKQCCSSKLQMIRRMQRLLLRMHKISSIWKMLPFLQPRLWPTATQLRTRPRGEGTSRWVMIRWCDRRAMLQNDVRTLPPFLFVSRRSDLAVLVITSLPACLLLSMIFWWWFYERIRCLTWDMNCMGWILSCQWPTWLH